MISHFLAASIEVQVMIFKYITRPTDLKALCLVSKDIYALAIPALYYQVDLTPRKLTHDENYNGLDPISSEQIQRVQSLLSKKQNISYIRILITSECGSVMTDMLSEVLENLGENQLFKLYYGNRGLLSTNRFLHHTENCFPTLEQMELIWARQGNLQTFYSRHIPALLNVLETNTLEATAIARPIKELILIEERPNTATYDSITWPLRNVYVPALRKLWLAGWHSQPYLPSLQNLFVANAFLHLTELCFRNVKFVTPLQLENCPLLRSLTIIHCKAYPDSGATLSIPRPLQVKSLYYAADSDVDQYKLLARITSQTRGLESLVLELISPESEDEDFAEEHIDQFRTELAFALEMQQGTLTELVVCEEQDCESRLVFGGEELFRAIQGCGQLYRLALALGLEDSVPWYSGLMQDLPRLAYYWLMFCLDYSPDCDDAEEILTQFINAIPADSNLRFFAYNWSCYSRQERENDVWSGQGEQGANTVGSAFKQIKWKRANPIFYNRYPCVPLLPCNLEPSDDLITGE